MKDANKKMASVELTTEIEEGLRVLAFQTKQSKSAAMRSLIIEGLIKYGVLTVTHEVKEGK